MNPGLVQKLVAVAALSLLLVGSAAAEDYAKLSLDRLGKLARQGDKIAQVELATALEHGEGIKKDVIKAISWYCLAASRGSVDAQRSLGWIYANGKGVLRNDRLAAYWLNKAAHSGDDYAARLVKRIVDSVAIPDETGCSHVASAPWLRQRCADSGCRQIVQMVEKLALEYRLDANLVLAVVSAESAFNPRALSKKNAQGLMQLLPATAKRFGVKEIWDREENLRGGMAYLRWLLAYFDGNVAHALAGYNAGENRVRHYGGVPPYPETKAYVKRIIRDYGKRFHHFDKHWLQGARPAGDSMVQTGKAARAQGG